jgi:imidazolonepropionase-like amidohydrolase
VLALAGGAVYTEPFADPIAGGTVLLDGRKIVAIGKPHNLEIPSGARVVDCSGATVTAGFWNCHVHLFERKWENAAAIPAEELSEQLQAFTRFGFSSVFDLGSNWGNTRIIRDRIAAGEVDGPAIFSTGEIIIPPGALPPQEVLRALGTSPIAAHEAATAEQGARSARAILEQGTDALKIFASGNAPSQKLEKGAFEAAVRQAHEMRKLVFAHVNDAGDVLRALEAGVDVLAHTTPRSSAWDSGILAAAKSRNAALTPTLGVYPHVLRHDRVSVVRQLRENAIAQLRAWLDMGATVLFGTDLGAVEPDPAPEFALMRQAGMSFAQILDSLTAAPARQFGYEATSGRIAPGYDADVTVFSTPFDVRYTIRAGCIVYEGS